MKLTIPLREALTRIKRLRETTTILPRAPVGGVLCLHMAISGLVLALQQ
jgi:hypothetical protein